MDAPLTPRRDVLLGSLNSAGTWTQLPSKTVNKTRGRRVSASAGIKRTEARVSYIHGRELQEPPGGPDPDVPTQRPGNQKVTELGASLCITDLFVLCLLPKRF